MSHILNGDFADDACVVSLSLSLFLSPSRHPCLSLGAVALMPGWGPPAKWKYNALLPICRPERTKSNGPIPAQWLWEKLRGPFPHFASPSILCSQTLPLSHEQMLSVLLSVCFRVHIHVLHIYGCLNVRAFCLRMLMFRCAMVHAMTGCMKVHPRGLLPPVGGHFYARRSYT